jgi:hypothetical protein
MPATVFTTEPGSWLTDEAIAGRIAVVVALNGIVVIVTAVIGGIVGISIVIVAGGITAVSSAADDSAGNQAGRDARANKSAAATIGQVFCLRINSPSSQSCSSANTFQAASIRLYLFLTVSLTALSARSAQFSALFR